jgi:rod shape-determining protein MreD
VPLLARVVLFGLLVALLQLALFSQLHVAGGPADLAPLAVMAVGLLLGALAGAGFGFALGLFLDVALLQVLGLSSLILLAVGYWCGRVREAREPEGPLVPIALGAAATLAAAVGFSLVQFLLDVDAPVSGAILRQLGATLILNTLLALPVYALARRLLRVEPPEPRRPRPRRRARTSPGLSPLQQP